MKKILANFEEIIASVFLTLIIGLTGFNVFLRLITSHSIIWLEEATYFCFAWVIYLGAAAAFKRGMHTGIDLLIRDYCSTAQI